MNNTCHPPTSQDQAAPMLLCISICWESEFEAFRGKLVSHKKRLLSGSVQMVSSCTSGRPTKDSRVLATEVTQARPGLH